MEMRCPADAETYHAWVAQIHAVDAVEISQLGIAETGPIRRPDATIWLVYPSRSAS